MITILLSECAARRNMGERVSRDYEIKYMLQVQATDLFAYLCRVDAERRFLGKEHPYRALCEEFNVPRTGKERIEIAGGFYGELHLRDYMESREEKHGK